MDVVYRLLRRFGYPNNSNISLLPSFKGADQMIEPESLGPANCDDFQDLRSRNESGRPFTISCRKYCKSCFFQEIAYVVARYRVTSEAGRYSLIQQCLERRITMAKFCVRLWTMSDRCSIGR